MTTLKDARIAELQGIADNQSTRIYELEGLLVAADERRVAEVTRVAEDYAAAVADRDLYMRLAQTNAEEVGRLA